MAILNYLIKPASGLCNMRCQYCFYADEMKNRTCKSYGVMTQETMEALIRHALAEQPDGCVFVFQGGEPTLAGLSYFQAFTETVRKYRKGGIPISYALQTNGYELDEEWAVFLSQERFLVGVSLDGYAELHNRYRLDTSGKNTFGRVMQAISLLKKHQVDFNILTVVTAQTARHTEKLYRFFAKQGFAYQQFLPCLEPLGEARGLKEYALTPSLYADFLKRLFDLWYADVLRGKQPYIRYFENLLGILIGQEPEVCGMQGCCTRQLVVEADGRVYPCDFYVLDGYCIGDVRTDSLAEIEEQRTRLGFIEESRAVDEECKACHWRFLCRGGCRRDRENGQGLKRNYFCGAYQEFFAYAYPRLKELAVFVQHSREKFMG